MAYPLKGQLGERIPPDLLLEIAARNLAGLLRISSGNTIKAVFFEDGRPVYAISSLPNEQFEHKLIRDRLATRGLIEAGKKRNDNAQCLGRTLVEIGVLKEKAMQESARALATEIMESLFELKQGEYAFEDGVTAVHDAILPREAAESILERARALSALKPAEPSIVTEAAAKPVDQDLPAKTAKPGVARKPGASGDLRPAARGSAARQRPQETGRFQPASSPDPPSGASGRTGLHSGSRPGLPREASGRVESQPAIRPSLPREASEPPGPASSPGLSGEVSGRAESQPAIRPGLPREPSGPAGFEAASSSGLPREVSGRAESQPAIRPGLPREPSGPACFQPASAPGLPREVSGSAGFHSASSPSPRSEVPSPAESRPTSSPGLPREASGVARSQPGSASGLRREPTGAAHLRSGSSSEASGPAAVRRPDGSQRAVVTTSGVSVDWLLQEVTRKLNSLEGADHYEVLGVTKLASTSTINAAYERLRGMFNSYRSSVPHHEQLSAKLDALFSRIKVAHDTLSDIERRRVYDIPPGKQPAEKLVVERGRAEVTRQPKPWNAVPNTGIKGNSAKDRPEERRSQTKAAVGAGAPAFPPPAPAGKHLGGFEAERVAAQNFQQGKACFDRRDLHTAVHMFREAVRLNDNRGDYHFHLGITLFILSQARSVHSHGEGCHVTCNLGGGLSRNQRIRREAEQHLLKAAEMDPYNAEIRVRLGLLYKDAGMAKKAQQAFHEALMLDASNVDALSELDFGGPEHNPGEDSPERPKPPAKKKIVK